MANVLTTQPFPCLQLPLRIHHVKLQLKTYLHSPLTLLSGHSSNLPLLSTSPTQASTDSPLTTNDHSPVIAQTSTCTSPMQASDDSPTTIDHSGVSPVIAQTFTSPSSLPSYSTLTDSSFVWVALDGPTFSASVSSCHDEIVHWRKNLFGIPSGRDGNSFIRELTNPTWMTHQSNLLLLRML